MASKKKGPRQSYGLKCTETGTVNYITMINKNNLQVKGKTIKDLKFIKYCPQLMKKTLHVPTQKLK